MVIKILDTSRVRIYKRVDHHLFINLSVNQLEIYKRIESRSVDLIDQVYELMINKEIGCFIFLIVFFQPVDLARLIVLLQVESLNYF